MQREDFLAHRMLQAALYMTEHEQQEALAAAGVTSARVELGLDCLVLYAAERAA